MTNKQKNIETKEEKRIIICRYSEIGLKGGNRHFFESKLIDNIRKCLKSNGVEYSAIDRLHGRIMIISDKLQDFSCLKRVFGLASYSVAIEAEKTIEGVMGLAKKLAIKDGLNDKKTFRVTTHRMDKQFPFTSQDVDVNVGRFLKNETGAQVKLKGADFELFIEIVRGRIYLFTKKKRCFGGLPAGSQGKIVLFIEEEKDILAGLLMMKRGASILPVAFDDFDVSLLDSYSFNKTALRQLHKYSELDELLQKTKAKLIVFGQTLDAIDDHGVKSTILRPLIGFTGAEIEKKLEEYKLIAGLYLDGVGK